MPKPTPHTEATDESREPREPLRLRVARVVEETADARSFVLDVPEALKGELRYAPGQYVTVEVPWESFRIRRCYSLSSTPELDAAPQFTVKRVEGGRMSNHLIDTVREGDELTIHRPAGRFVLGPDARGATLSLFAGGSGITPVFSILKAALRDGTRRIRLLYANRDAASTIFARELAELARAHADRLEVHHHHDDASGYLTPESLDGWLRRGESDARASDHYVCGPGPFMAAVHDALRAARVPDERIWIEKFVSPEDPDRRDASGAEVAMSAGAPESFLVTLGSKIHRVPYESPRTLLAACKAAGVRAPSSCEDGFCGSCMARLVEGEVTMANPLALSDRDVERGRVLACQARPARTGFLHVDFDAVSFSATSSGEDGLAPPISGLRVAVVVALCVGAAFLVRWLHAVV
jgi:3-ketosteroid 9alpha-monooxygenase subunit B